LAQGRDDLVATGAEAFLCAREQVHQATLA
jgi:hypothetical protein